ncbi:MAG: hypothetical protein GY757_52470, partial [bacterium]|nr:hypothetical protein [bacterium]
MKKNRDMTIIKRLEEELDIKLERKSLERMKRYPERGYYLDTEGRVKGLNLYSIKKINVFLVAELQD